MVSIEHVSCVSVNREGEGIQLPQDIYAKQLRIIAGINFTQREVDIITCMLSGKTAKKIAELLFISPKTVEVHIRNIVLKFECNTKSAMIDLMEKSNKFPLVKKHYSSLLIQHTFVLELKKIAKMLTQKLSCLIIYNRTVKRLTTFFSYLIRDLQVVGIDVCMQHVQKNELSLYLVNNTQHFANNIIIYYLEPEQVESLEFKEMVQVACQRFWRLIFINIAHGSVATIPIKLSHFETIVLQDPKNYYYFVFEVVEKLLSPLDLQENISVLTQKYETLSGLSTSCDIAVQQTEIITPVVSGNIIFNTLKKKKILALIFVVICIIFFGIALSNKINHKQIANGIKNQSANNYALMEWNFPRQDSIFVNRKSLYNQLNIYNSNYKKHSLYDQPAIVSVFSGLGGVGKTQLALKYANQFKGFYTLKAWFYAENIVQLKQQYIEFSKVLGYKEVNPSFETAFSYIKTSLSKYPNWLFIYDNVTNYKEIKDFLPENGGHIVITTRQRYWPSAFNMFNIPVMTKDESLQLVESITSYQVKVADRGIVENLIEKLGYLPLALSQVSAYIRNNGISFAEYVKLYDQAEQKMLAIRTMPEGTEHVPISITWNANFDAIKTEAIQENLPPLAAILMTVCAYLEPNQIPKELLLIWLKKNYPEQKNHELILNHMLGQLNRYSLITLDPDKETIDIHRLVQAVLRHQHRKIIKKLDPYYPPITKGWYEDLLKVVYEEFTQKNLPTKDLQKKQLLLPHLQSIIAHHANLGLDAKSYILALANFEVGVALLYKEPYLSKIYLEQSLDIFEKKDGLYHLNVSRTLRNLGHIYGALGNIEESKVLLERALEIDEQIKSSEIASTLNNLGNVYGTLGRVKEQCQLLERVLKLDEQSSNPNNNDLAVSLNNLGNAYVASGEVNKGKSMLELSLGIFEKEYGKDDFKVGSVLTSLGHAYWVLGDLSLAQVQLERALKIKRGYYSTEHIAMGITLNNLGNVHKDLGDTNQAIFYLEQALKISEQHYGTNNLATAIILNNLGEVYQKIKNVNHATFLFTRAREIKKEYKVGAKSLNFGTAYGILGDANHKKCLQCSSLNN